MWKKFVKSRYDRFFSSKNIGKLFFESSNNDGSNKQKVIDITKFFSSHFNGKDSGNNGASFKFLLLIIFIIWMLSGVFLVDDKGGEQAVILRFGKVVRLADSGLNYRLPYPIEKHIIAKVHKARTFSVGMSNAESLRLKQNKNNIIYFKGKNSNVSSPMVRLFNTKRLNNGNINTVNKNSFMSQAFMLTRDFNVLNCSMSVMWSINNLKNYLFKVRDPEGTLKLLAEAVLRAVIAQTVMDIALTKGKLDIQREVQDRLQKVVNDYNLGILIRRIELQNVEEPLPVRSAFREVENARQDREKMINIANADAIKKRTLAQGEAKKITIGAQAYKEQIIEETKGEFQRYKSLIKGLKLAPKINRERIWLEMAEAVLANSNNKILLPKENTGQLMPLLPLSGIMSDIKSKKIYSSNNKEINYQSNLKTLNSAKKTSDFQMSKGVYKLKKG